MAESSIFNEFPALLMQSAVKIENVGFDCYPKR